MFQKVCMVMLSRFENSLNDTIASGIHVRNDLLKYDIRTSYEALILETIWKKKHTVAPSVRPNTNTNTCHLYSAKIIIKILYCASQTLHIGYP